MEGENFQGAKGDQLPIPLSVDDKSTTESSGNARKTKSTFCYMKSGLFKKTITLPQKTQISAFRRDLVFIRSVDLSISPVDIFVFVREAWRPSAKLTFFFMLQCFIFVKCQSDSHRDLYTSFIAWFCECYEFRHFEDKQSHQYLLCLWPRSVRRKPDVIMVKNLLLCYFLKEHLERKKWE